MRPERYERVRGMVRMMTRGTIDHNRITLNLARGLSERLKELACDIFMGNIKVVSPEGDVFYPDVVVVCGKVPGEANELEAPIVAVEVLSGRGPNRWSYQTIGSLRHYVLIDQDQPVVEVASRNDDGSWRSVIHRGLDARLRLDALGVEIGLEEVFARVVFARASRAKEPEASVRWE